MKVDAGTLLSIPRAEVFVCRPSGKALGKRATFYRSVRPLVHRSTYENVC